MTATTTVSFGDYLRRQRKQAGLTQRELGDLCGVDFTYISKLENNAAPVPSIQTLRRMADVFHVTDAQMCAAAGRLDSDLSKQELELYVLQLLQVHENTMQENRALAAQVRVLHDRIEALEVQLAAMSDYVERLTTQLTEARNALQELEHRAFRYTLDAEPFWGIEDDVMQRLRLALSSLEVGS